MADTKIQLNLTFIPAEDRILFRIASGMPSVAMEEYRLWLTRRFVKLLWGALDRMIDTATGMNPHIAPEGRNAVKEFQESAALAKTDFTTPYATERITAPLGMNPLLIHRYETKKESGGNHILSLEATTGQAINITLSMELVHSLRKLLADVIRQADWDIQTDVTRSHTGALVAEAPRTIN